MSLKLEDVTYTYSPGTAYEMHALEHINLEIPNGQFVGIIGHTGSGKSTLVQHLNGLIRPTLGRVLYNGEDIWKEGYPLRELRSHVGLVFQYPEHQLFETDVITDVCFGPKIRDFHRRNAENGRKRRWIMSDFQRKCMKNRRLNSPEVRNVVLRLPVCLQ